MPRSLEEDLEDYIWGRTKEQDYLLRVVNNDGLATDDILRKVSQVDDTLNKLLRKGVEENLSRLLEQTTALEALDRTQRGVHSEMNDVFEGCDKFAKSLDGLLSEYREQSMAMEQLVTLRNMMSDAMRCEELMESLERRSELVKRSEIVCEMRGIVEDNPDLLNITWLRDTVTSKLKALENEVRRAAADDLRRALISLNASLVASAVRALSNLGVFEAELEVQLSSSASEVDVKLRELLAVNPEGANRLLPVCVNLIHTQLEQCALLGSNHMNKFTEKLARIIKARVPLDAPFALRLVQQMGRVLQSRPECSLGPLNEALRPLKNALLSHALSRLHQLVEQHDFQSTQANAFVDVLNCAIEEELKKVEWDNDLKEEMQKNIRKCIDMVAKRLEAEIKLDSEHVLLGDRLSAVQLNNYRLLQTGHLLSGRWASHSAPLVTLERESICTIMTAIRSAISTILLSMHSERLGGKDVSPYMQELVAFLGRVMLHASHLSSVLRQSATLPILVDYVINQFLFNATLIRPVPQSIRHQLALDFQRLLDILSEMDVGTVYAEPSRLLSLWTTPLDELNWDRRERIPSWAVIQLLIADSPNTLVSPHTSVDWTVEQYVQWCSDHTEVELLAFLNGLISSYSSSVRSRGETEYVPYYPRIIDILQKAMNNSFS